MTTPSPSTPSLSSHSHQAMTTPSLYNASLFTWTSAPTLSGSHASLSNANPPPPKVSKNPTVSCKSLACSVVHSSIYSSDLFATSHCMYPP